MFICNNFIIKINNILTIGVYFKFPERVPPQNCFNNPSWANLLPVGQRQEGGFWRRKVHCVPPCGHLPAAMLFLLLNIKQIAMGYI